MYTALPVTIWHHPCWLIVKGLLPHRPILDHTNLVHTQLCSPCLGYNVTRDALKDYIFLPERANQYCCHGNNAIPLPNHEFLWNNRWQPSTVFFYCTCFFNPWFFPESIYINKSKGCSVITSTRLCTGSPEETKGVKGAPVPGAGQWWGWSPRVLQFWTHQHSPQQAPSLPCTAPAKHPAPPEAAVRETKKPHHTQQSNHPR